MSGAAVFPEVLRQRYFSQNNVPKIEAFLWVPRPIRASSIGVTVCAALPEGFIKTILLWDNTSVHLFPLPLFLRRSSADVKLELWSFSSSSGTRASLKFFGRLAGTPGSLYYYSFYS